MKIFITKYFKKYEDYVKYFENNDTNTVEYLFKFSERDLSKFSIKSKFVYVTMSMVGIDIKFSDIEIMPDRFYGNLIPYKYTGISKRASNARYFEHFVRDKIGDYGVIGSLTPTRQIYVNIANVGSIYGTHFETMLHAVYAELFHTDITQSVNILSNVLAKHQQYNFVLLNDDIADDIIKDYHLTCKKNNVVEYPIMYIIKKNDDMQLIDYMPSLMAIKGYFSSLIYGNWEPHKLTNRHTYKFEKYNTTHYNAGVAYRTRVVGIGSKIHATSEEILIDKVNLYYSLGGDKLSLDKEQVVPENVQTDSLSEDEKRTRCKCGSFVGKILEGETCPTCKCKVEIQDAEKTANDNAGCTNKDMSSEAIFELLMNTLRKEIGVEQSTAFADYTKRVEVLEAEISKLEKENADLRRMTKEYDDKLAAIRSTLI